MLNTIKELKHILIPALKDELRNTVNEYINCTIYSEPVDLNVPSGYGGGIGSKRIRVIGRIVTVY